MKRLSKTVVLIAVMTSLLALSVTPANATTTEYDLWVNPDSSGFVTKDYAYTPFLPHYVGQHYYEWMIEYIENDNPSYDYYAVHIFQRLNPSINQGNGWVNINSGNTKIDLITSRQMVATRLPDRSTGTFSYGTGVSVGTSSASFSVTASYSSPDVEIDPNTDSNWGGVVQWTYRMNTDDAKCDEHQLHFTALIRTYEGDYLSATVTLATNWYDNWYHRFVYFTETFNLYYDGTPSGGGGGCPNLLVWDGSSFVDEGVLSIHNPSEPESDVILYHTLTTTPAIDHHRLTLELFEDPRGYDSSHSWIDQVSLYSIDRNGVWHKCPLVSAVHSEDGKVLKELLRSDDRWAETLLGNKIILQFIVPRLDSAAQFVFVIEGHNRKAM